MDYNQISKEETKVVGVSESGPSTGEIQDMEQVETINIPIGMVQVKAHKLYLRKSANDKAERVIMLSKGDVLEVDKKLPGWYSAITEDGKRGFVMKEYVEVVY